MCRPKRLAGGRSYHLACQLSCDALCLPQPNTADCRTSFAALLETQTTCGYYGLRLAGGQQVKASTMQWLACHFNLACQGGTYVCHQAKGECESLDRNVLPEPSFVDHSETIPLKPLRFSAGTIACWLSSDLFCSVLAGPSCHGFSTEFHAFTIAFALALAESWPAFVCHMCTWCSVATIRESLIVA